MRRVVAFLRFTDGQELDWPRLQGGCRFPEADAATLLRVAPPPEGLPYRPAGSPAPEASWRDYDAVLLLDGIHRAPDWARLDVSLSVVHAYAVEARQMFERGDPAREPEAITLLGRLMFHADLPDSAARRSWSLHAPLAERVHVGATGYIQNWVVASLSPDCPHARGLPQMRWPDERTLVARFFDSARGHAEILQDTAHFIASGPRFYLRGI